MIRIFAVVSILLNVISIAEARPTADAKSVEAKQRYESGLAHFNLQEYKQSIDDFEAAYRLKPDPVFLYNLAQAHRLSENAERALYFYRTYLRSSSNPPNRREVEARIDTLEKLLVQKQQLAAPPDHTLAPADGKDKAPQPAPEPAPVARPAPTPAPAPVVVEPGRRADVRTPVYKRWWLWTIVGVAVAGAAVGVGLGIGLSAKPTFDAGLGTVGPSALGVRF